MYVVTITHTVAFFKHLVFVQNDFLLIQLMFNKFYPKNFMPKKVLHSKSLIPKKSLYSKLPSGFHQEDVLRKGVFFTFSATIMRHSAARPVH